jgi:uncharacterized damage-inducible protein DinB
MSKSNREFFKERWEAEMPAFGRVLRALPKDRLDYRPHERSASASGLGWQLAVEQQALSTLCEKGEVEWSQPEAAGDHDAMIAAWDKATEELRGRLASLDDAAWEKKAKFLMPGAPAWETTLDEMFWGFLFDMIHHRGQLSTYIRPMGGKVPAIYGPSADDAGG